MSSPFFLNAELVKTVESVPDTVITLVSGEKLLVRESANEVVERIKQYRRSVLHPLSSKDTPS
ncbi:MAG: flagellar FlbD family protein [Bdellovibrionales bacterium]|nr:flagellar FlbD family protein [Bdellovibrionales bacterium]